MLHKKIKL